MSMKRCLLSRRAMMSHRGEQLAEICLQPPCISGATWLLVSMHQGSSLAVCTCHTCYDTIIKQNKIVLAYWDFDMPAIGLALVVELHLVSYLRLQCLCSCLRIHALWWMFSVVWGLVHYPLNPYGEWFHPQPPPTTTKKKQRSGMSSPWNKHRTTLAWSAHDFIWV